MRKKRDKVCRIEFLPPEWQPTRFSEDNDDDVVFVSETQGSTCSKRANVDKDNMDVESGDDQNEDPFAEFMDTDDDIIELPTIYPEDIF